jgi:hypothetical protein
MIGLYLKRVREEPIRSHELTITHLSSEFLHPTPSLSADDIATGTSSAVTIEITSWTIVK